MAKNREAARILPGPRSWFRNAEEQAVEREQPVTPQEPHGPKPNGKTYAGQTASRLYFCYALFVLALKLLGLSDLSWRGVWFAIAAPPSAILALMVTGLIVFGVFWLLGTALLNVIGMFTWIFKSLFGGSE